MLPNLRVFNVVCNYLGYFTLRCLRKQPRRGYSAAALLSGGCLAFVPKFLFFISSSSKTRLPAAYHPRGIHVFYSIYRPAFFEYTQSMFSPCRCIIPKYDSSAFYFLHKKRNPITRIPSLILSISLYLQNCTQTFHLKPITISYPDLLVKPSTD